MPNKIKDGTVLYCDYMHLNSAKDARTLSEEEKEQKGLKGLCKEWKVESKIRPVLILYECKEENFRYCSYVILQLTTAEETAKNNSYLEVGHFFGKKEISYARPYPETYPDHLLDQNGKTDKINHLILESITEKIGFSKMGCP